MLRTREGAKDSGCTFRLAYFRPASGLNEETRRLHAIELLPWRRTQVLAVEVHPMQVEAAGGEPDGGRIAGNVGTSGGGTDNSRPHRPAVTKNCRYYAFMYRQNLGGGAVRDERKQWLERLGAFFRPTEAEAAGISYDTLQGLVRDGLVEHVSWGLYRRVDAEPTEVHSLAAVCARARRAVVCLVSALQIHDIGSRLPAEVWLAVPNKARAPRLRGIKVRLVRFSGPAWTYGVEPIELEGVAARITNPARTVVDCFRFHKRVGGEAAKEALHDALRRRLVTVDALYRTLEVLPSSRLRAALEAMP